MNQYRIYCLTDEGSFSKVHEVEAISDAAALAFARQLNHAGPCEVWQGRRLVGAINAKEHSGAEHTERAATR